MDTLVKGMEDQRGDLIVIVAGYTERMKRFIAANPGLKSRFNKFIEFPDYTAEELTEIFKSFCRKNKYRVSRPALEYVREHFEKRIAEKPENFANAREARNLFEFAISRQANRVIVDIDPTEDLLTLIRREDVMGRVITIGKEQFLAENALADLSEKRAGIPSELLKMKLDELELAPRSIYTLRGVMIRTVGDLLDFFEAGGMLRDLGNLSEKNEEEIYQVLESLGWTGRA